MIELGLSVPNFVKLVVFFVVACFGLWTFSREVSK